MRLRLFKESFLIICLLLSVLSGKLFASITCSIVNWQGEHITAAKAGDTVYLKDSYIETHSGKLSWTLKVNLPTTDPKKYNVSVKKSGYYYHTGSSQVNEKSTPVAIPAFDYIKGSATITYTLSKNGKCTAPLYISEYTPPHPDTFTITASAGANGSISPSGQVTVNYGGNQSFTILPDPNYHVADVLVDGASVGAVASYTFTNIISAHTISASFESNPPNTHTITATAGANGSIFPSGSIIVNSGSNQSFTITPADNYHIADVLVDGTSVGAVTSYTFLNITSGHTISAGFAGNSPKTYTITASAGTNGTITPSGSVTVTEGASQSFNITPNSGYNISDVLVDNSSVGAVTAYTFTNVNADHTISASFVLQAETLHVPSQFSTIQDALNAAQKGNEILVAPGAYNENITLKNGVKLTGAGAYKTIIRGTGTGPVVSGPAAFTDGAIIRDISIENGTQGILLSSGTITLTGCVVKNNSAQGVHLTNSEATVSNCRISSNSSDGIFSSQSSLTVSNTVINSNTGSGISSSASIVSVSFCTINGNYINGISSNNSAGEIRNSIISLNSGNGIYLNSLSLTLSNLNFWNNNCNWAAGTFCYVEPEFYSVISSILTDPLFTGTTDFHLMPGSPAMTASSTGSQIGAYGNSGNPPD